ncbi:MAG: hypothetical protein HYV13_00620 [Candidatus Doudnabacteria bacterium]|nr:hypothetical protein [Candidatus Doudnabacteria bacterium]
MKQKTYLTITPFLFLVIAVVHLIRIWKGWDISIAGSEIPLWASWAALVVASYLSYSGYKLK